MSSAPRQMDKTDLKKVGSAFLWNFGSLIVTTALALLALPAEELPSWLLWLIPLAPALNAVLYAGQRFIQDNR